MSKMNVERETDNWVHDLVDAAVAKGGYVLGSNAENTRLWHVFMLYLVSNQIFGTLQDVQDHTGWVMEYCLTPEAWFVGAVNGRLRRQCDLYDGTVSRKSWREFARSYRNTPLHELAAYIMGVAPGDETRSI